MFSCCSELEDAAKTPAPKASPATAPTVIAPTTSTTTATTTSTTPKETTMTKSTLPLAPATSAPLQGATHQTPFKFDPDFLWGFATASYQIEGAVNEGGRGKTIWDTFCHTPGKIADNSNADVICDTYHRWKEDIALMKSYGAKSYRFSLAWSRIIPSGSRHDPVNEEGIKFYSDFIDELIRNDIVPFVTLYHWDLPQGLMDKYDGLLSVEEFPLDFERYARVCFERFGDRVRHWLTFNEPFVSCKLGYGYGVHAPGRTSDRSRSAVGDTSREPWQAGHSILIAHGRAVKLYRDEFQKKQGGKISITLNCDWGEPYTEDSKDKEAAVRYLEFYVCWFADPIYFGDYPASMRAQLGDRLPKFTPEQVALVKGSSDFFGLNHYTARYIQHRDLPAVLEDLDGNVIQHTEDKYGVPIGPRAESFWLYVVPWGVRKLLNWLSERYGKPDIYITENGCSAPNETKILREDAIKDLFRVEYYKGYLANVKLAVQDGVSVKSYFAWSLLGELYNPSLIFEWADGRSCRFGVTYVDFDTLERTPKDSARYVTSFFKKYT
ncbi:hypothetical protein HDV05_004676 [Chytridiales sp. JEL 0842]|nr:hypothetical protein HDV05_004676 [Chytridiales sp. JEL 0842]